MPAIETTLGIARGADDGETEWVIMVFPYDGITRTGSKGLSQPRRIET